MYRAEKTREDDETRVSLLSLSLSPLQSSLHLDLLIVNICFSPLESGTTRH